MAGSAPPGSTALGRGADAQRPGQRAVPPRQPRMGGDVLARYLGEDPLLDAEEGTDPVEHAGRLLDQGAVPEDHDLLPGEHRVQVLKLLAVPAERRVAPELRPARRDPAVFLRAGPHHVINGIQARPTTDASSSSAHAPPGRAGSDQPGVRDQRPDALLRGTVVQVERRGLTAQGTRRSRLEQRLVVVSPPYVLTVRAHVPGPPRLGGGRR